MQKVEEDEKEKIVFEYNKVEMLRLQGKQVIAKDTKYKTGRIEFYKNEVKIFLDNSFERFSISEIHKHDNGYQLRSENNQGDKCVIAIIRRNGLDLVTAHFIEINMMGMFYISKGFSSDIEFLN
ncbi:MAG: hypothetical protein R6U66_11425 [Bacteroidales bacterium]